MIHTPLLRPLLLLLLLLLTCCSSAPEEEPVMREEMTRDMAGEEPDSTEDAPGDLSAMPPTGSPVPSVGCDLPSTWTPGATALETMERDGQTRSWRVRLPSTYTQSTPLPVLFVLHGGLGDSARTERVTQFNSIAEREGVILVYPDGYAKRPGVESEPLKLRTWNAGTCCGGAQESEIDDVAFLLDVLKDTEARACLDRRRVYATGMSNGAMMMYRLACEAATHFAALAPVSGSLVLTSCEPARAVPLLHIHGLKDPSVPFEGGSGCGLGTLDQSVAIPAVIKKWSALHGCVDTTTTLDREDVTCVTQNGCEARVQLCTLPEGGHSWPGGLPGSDQNSASCPDAAQIFSFDASAHIMEFVLNHTLEDVQD